MSLETLTLECFVIVDKVGEPMGFNTGKHYGIMLFDSKEKAQETLLEYLKETDTKKWWEVIPCNYSVKNKWGYTEK